MLNSIDVNRLKVFYYIYVNQSISGAARELNVTPSAVSQHLKKLEYEIKVPLFTRMHKRLVPAAAATTLFHILHPFFLELEAGLKLLRSGRDEPSGRVKFGAPVEFGKANFPQMMGAFRKEYPEVTFDLTLGNSEKMLEMVKEGELDFAMVDLFLSQRHYVADLGLYYVESIMDEEVILACSAAYFNDTLRGNLSLSHLLTQDFISYDHHDLAITGWFKHHFGRKSVTVNVVLTVDSIQAVRSALVYDMGLGVITRDAVRGEIDHGSVVVIHTDKPEIVNQISLVQLQDKIPSFTEKRVQAYFKEALQGKGSMALAR